MKLKTFQVINYRSIKNSGVVPLDKVAVLVGRNESGKSNLLLALESLNPTEGVNPLSFTKDFPREKLRSEFKETAVVVDSLWELNSEHFQNVQRIWRRVAGPAFRVSRTYHGQVNVEFLEVSELSLASLEVRKTVSQIEKTILSATKDMEEYARKPLEVAYETFNIALKEVFYDVVKDAESIKKTFEALIQSVRLNYGPLAEEIQTKSIQLIRGCNAIFSDSGAQEEAEKWVLSNLPKFIYLNDYPELNGHQKISDYLSECKLEKRSEAHRNFERLCKVAGLDPRDLSALESGHHAERQQLVNRAGATVTKSLQELWQDRKLKIRFSLDGDNFDTLVTDSTDGYDVEVNLDERSRGLKWFFSFWIAFAADTKNGDKSNAILLLDEPGLFLHVLAQKDLVSILRETLGNQVIYTTHSPFMIPIAELAWVKTVVNEPGVGTRVTQILGADEKTLFPLQTALGYNLSQDLFKGQKYLIVKEIADFHLLMVIREILEIYCLQTWPKELVILAVGEAQKIPYMVALLASQQLKVVVLIDGDQQGNILREEMLRTKLLKLDYIALISEAAAPGETVHEIEDLISPENYDVLVKEEYSKELEGKSLVVNERNLRQVKRYEEGFQKLGMAFDRKRITKLIIEKHGKRDLSLSPQTISRFESLAKLINTKIARAFV